MTNAEIQAHPPPWHAQSPGQVLARLDTAESGLGSDDAQRRLKQHGPNRLPEPRRRGLLLRFLLQFHNVLIYLLLASAVITAMLGHWVDTSVILAVVMINALVGLVQEGKAERALQAIRQMLAPRAAALRDGTRCSVDAAELVPGDIVLLEAGDKVPADLRVLSVSGMIVQEAVLTGESASVEKQREAVADRAELAERFSMLYCGTLVVGGQGRGVVVATGGQTEIGRISHLMSEVESLTTPLVRQMSRFSQWLTGLIVLVAAVLLSFGYFRRGHEFSELFMAVVSLSVAAIPEGLPAVLTITLAVGVQSVARRHVIVRRLPALETLGSVSVICTDKTGTLTRNEMMVVSVVAGGRTLTVEGEGYAPQGRVVDGDRLVEPGEHALLQQLGRAASLCNDAVLRSHDDAWIVEGDPMEGALLSFAGKLGMDAGAGHTWTRVDLIPFDARYRYMATLNADPQGQRILFVKGAPERILAMCSDQLRADGTTAPLADADWQARVEGLAGCGQRVLALAMRVADDLPDKVTHEQIDGRLTLLGIVGMVDPPRAEAIAAVADCHSAGIQVKMITGDHAKTASAIGTQIGLQHVSRVLTGAELDRLSDDELRRAVIDCDIFARTSPEHKLRLVMALQAHGLTVAMTGDGVNDAPALKRADAGVAMGGKGSEAAKEAAELVLVDDNFASIVAAVREGRTVYDNIKKVISWTLPTNAGEAMTVIVALLLGLALPVTPVQLLWVNLITAVTLGLALAFEPTEPDTMRRPPRARNEPLLSTELVWHIALVSGLFLAGVYGIDRYALAQGYAPELARTLAVNTLVSMEIFHLFFIRNIHGTSLSWRAVRGTPVVWMTVGTVALAQLAFTYLPPMQRWFGTAAVSMHDGLLIVGIGLALFSIIEAEKRVRRRLWSRGRAHRRHAH